MLPPELREFLIQPPGLLRANVRGHCRAITVLAG